MNDLIPGDGLTPVIPQGQRVNPHNFGNALSQQFQSPLQRIQSWFGDTLNSQPNLGQERPGFMDSMLGWTEGNGTRHGGWGGLALGGASALANFRLGSKQLGMAKTAMRENRRQFDLNYNNQVQSYNNRLSDRQNARVAASPNAQDTASYMKQWGV